MNYDEYKKREAELNTKKERERMFHVCFDGRPALVWDNAENKYVERDPKDMKARISWSHAMNRRTVDELFSIPTDTIHTILHPKFALAPDEQEGREEFVKVLRDMISSHGLTPTDDMKIATYYSATEYDITGIVMYFPICLNPDWMAGKWLNFWEAR